MENTENQNISTHDSAVLSRIFNPSLPYGDVCDEESQAETVPGNDILFLLQEKSLYIALHFFFKFGRNCYYLPLEDFSLNIALLLFHRLETASGYPTHSC